MFGNNMIGSKLCGKDMIGRTFCEKKPKLAVNSEGKT
jgi:hypothetical protein